MDPDVYARMARHEEHHWWFRGRRHILSRLLAGALAGRGPLDILEAGCGTGGNFAWLSSLGHLHAFEPDTGALQLACRHGPAVEGALPADHPFTGQRFDLIVLLDVLEHVEPDAESLRSLSTLLKPGGLLLMTVPAFPFLWSGHDVRHHHFRRYRRAGLRQLLEQAGLRIRRLSYYNFWLFPAIALLRVLRTRTRPRRSDDEELPPFLVNSLLSRLFSSEALLLAFTDLPFGVSLVALAEKPDASVPCPSAAQIP